jgi:hypothetical protein
MEALSHIFVDISGLVVTYLVPVVVWVMLAVGLYQLVREKIGQVGVMPRGSRRIMRNGLVSRLVEAGRSP